MRANYIPTLEKEIENHVVKFAKRNKCMVRKMNGTGFRAWPDRLFIMPNGKQCWIEFKAPGKGATPAQTELHQWLASLQQLVYVINNREQGTELIKYFMASK
jgi:hypothetical protein